MKYGKAFKESWENLCAMSKKGKFIPNKKQDFVDMMKNLINEHELIHESVEFRSYKQIYGMDVFKLKAIDRNAKDEHCLFAGFEILTEIKNKKTLLDEYCNFISELYNEFESSVRRCFVIFDKTNTLTKEDIKFLKKCQKTDKVKVFLC